MRVTISFRFKSKKARPDGTCPIYARITMQGKRVEVSTGIFADLENWDGIRQRLKGNSSKVRVVNNRLDKAYSNILDIYNQLEALNTTFTVIDIKSRLSGPLKQHTLLEVFDYYIDTIQSQIGMGFSLGTLKHYRTSKNRVIAFLHRNFNNGDIALDCIDYHFINSFDVFLKERYRNKLNTAWGYHKNLKKILNIAVSLDYLMKNPYEKFKVRKQETKREYLTLLELDRIKNKTIQINRLKIVRDIFLFACYTGLCYSDIAKLSKKHVQRGFDGDDWIIIDRTKTNTRCRLPLLQTPKEILLHYKNNPVCINRNRLLPVLTNQRMNSYLKELADICDINKNLTMHVARHTFATSVTLNNGIPIETVSKILGHSSIKTTQIYARILDYKISEDMKKLQ